MSGPISPFFSPGGGFGITGSRSAGWTLTKTAEAGVAETILTLRDTEDLAAGWVFGNGSATAGRMVPQLTTVGPNTVAASAFIQNTQTQAGLDSGSQPLYYWNFTISTGTAVASRTLLSLRNNAVEILGLIPINSGANSALSWGGQAGGAPTFTTRSAGTRAVWQSGITAALVDFATGVGGTTILWHSVPDATSSYQHILYGATTAIHRVRGDGQVTSTGSKVDKVRVALTTPVTVVAGTDYIIVVNLTTPGAVAVNLPATPATGLTYIIKDGKGDAAANNITITPAAGNIDGAATLVIAANFGRAMLTYNGTEWNVIT